MMKIVRGLFNSNDDTKILSCFWIFFFLLMTEGIFRRWLLPSLSDVFLVARDPFVLYAVIIGVKRNYIKNFFSYSFIILGFTTFFVTMMAGHGNVIVAIYGVRISMLYFPFMYVLGKVLTRDDVLKMGSIFVKLIVPMAMLNIVQFFSPQSSFVNIGVGGDENGAGFIGGAMGFYRPPGIFTFIAALTDYYAISLCFLLYFLYDRNIAEEYGIRRPYLYLTVGAFIVSMFVTISRSHFISTLGILVASLFSFKNKKKQIVSIFLIVVISYIILSSFDEFNLFVDVFFARFNGANESEGGIGNSLQERLFGYMGRAMELAPAFGYGEGTFTNFGVKYIYGTLETGGQTKMLYDAAEFEWGRLILEDGLILGLIYIFLRLIMSFKLLIDGFKSLRRNMDPLLWFLTPYAVVMLSHFQLKTAYHLGFMCVLVASCLALGKNDNCKI